jgi:oxygen-independent coproporphyrinogen-3 oxidase
MKPLGIYLHVPFCRSKCLYCDFRSRPPAPGEIDRYLRALQTEIRLRASDRPVASLYIGGGTPSFIGGARLSAAIDAVRSAFRLAPDCEITVEANPSDVTDDWLASCRAAGVNRLSLGVQGMRDTDLRFLERAHTVAQALAAAHRARAAGFDNLSIDLIVGLPGHTPDLTKELLTQAVDAFAPEHLSCYQLTCAPGTRLNDAVQRGEVNMPDTDTESAIFMTTHETLQGLGYEGYEISNFARTPARRSRHNSAYWTHQDYIGLGPSAHSFQSPVRSWNEESLDPYCAALERNELPAAGTERLTALQRAEEIILLGLRTRDGFSLETLRKECGIDLLAQKSAVIHDALSSGLLLHTAGRLHPTLNGLALADSLAADLAPDGASD